MNRIGVTGPRGRLGSFLVSCGCTPIESDILKAEVLKSEISKIAPDVIIHTAAYTNVDMAEDNPEQAMRVNARGTANVRDAFLGRIILISTDFVFDGRAGPYRENDLPNPINWYGHSKLAAEAMVDAKKDMIVRTTLLYGNQEKSDFVQSIRERYEAQTTFFVTEKMFGNPTYIPHLSEALIELCLRMGRNEDLPHILNVAGRQNMSRYQFAQLIGDVFNVDQSFCQPSLIGMTTDRARRIKRGGFRLDLADKLKIPIHNVRDGLYRMMEEIE